MTLKELKEIVFEANLDLVRYQLVLFTWGNASGIDRERELIVIKPSGISYRELTADMLVVLDFQGNIVEGQLNPSSDTPTHLVLYHSFPEIGGVVHTHSTYATAWSQAQRDIPANGTTHADYFYQEIPCTRSMTQEEIFGNYETETGKVIAECFRTRQINPVHVPGVLVSNHGPFTWGNSVTRAVENAVVLEEVARMAFLSASLNPLLPMNPLLVEKHFSRKHGANAYYGQ
jgi:L-ribulose-5-phosphate 4-epimerase